MPATGRAGYVTEFVPDHSASSCRRAPTAGASGSVIWWVQRLTKTERLRKNMLTAATGR